MPLNTRFNHQAMVVSGTGANNVVTYFNGTKDLSLTADATTSNASIYFQNDTGSDPSSCYISEIKIYNAILTADEIRREMLTIGPFRKLGLNSYLPCLGSYDAGIDHSGYGRNFTVGGTYTSQADFLRAYRNGPLQVRMPDRWLMGSPPAAKPKGPVVTSRPDLP